MGHLNFTTCTFPFLDRLYPLVVGERIIVMSILT